MRSEIGDRGPAGDAAAARPSERYLGLALVVAQFLLLGTLVATGPVIPRSAPARAVAVASLALGIWSMAVVGRGLRATPEPAAGARLVVRGPFRRIRHPMYAAVLALTGALAVDHLTMTRLAAWAGLAAVLIAKMALEERLLARRFKDYAAYRARTHRLIPRVFTPVVFGLIACLAFAPPADAARQSRRGKGQPKAAAQPSPPADSQSTRAAPADAGPPAVLAYRFDLQRNPALAVLVAASFRGDAAGVTTFGVTREWGGVDQGGDDLFDLAVADSAGKVLAAEHPEPNRWRVHHRPGALIVVSYRLRPNEYQADPSPDTNRRPILNSDLLHFYGELGLVRPISVTRERRCRVTFDWNGFGEAGWAVATSFGVGATPRVVEAPLNDILESVFVSGAIRIHSREIHGRPVYVALSGNGWGFTDEAFVDLAARIIAVEREFFSDLDDPYYLISVIPVGASSPGSRSVGGTGLTQSFALEMTADTALEDRLAGPGGVPGLLAHEMFHQWNGKTIRPADPEELAYWFTEGFTNFFARRMLQRAGLVNGTGYANSVNHVLASYYLSPAREEPNERIRAEFWRDRAIGELPYQRGDIIAMMLDRRIQRVSRGARSLDHFMRDRVAAARAGERITTASLIAQIARETGAGTAERVRRVVEDGALPEIADDTFAPCWELGTDSLGVFELGFDFGAAQKDHVVRDLVPGSAAAVAGLREGDRVTGWSAQIGNAASPVTVKVHRDEGAVEVSYLPVGAKRPVPQIHPRAGADSADCRD